MANHIAHFEIFASDVERARRFYEQVFGWQFEAGGPPDFYHIATGARADRGVSQGLIARRAGRAAEGHLNSFRCTISVDSIGDTVKAIEAAGGTLRSAVIEIPNVGRLVEFADTDGNVACAMQYV
jgi:predicted enzyme related to lactoylglutathione lyase